jgi:predicted  nucleic acid-binding Zn-ribbon protein
MEQGVKLPSVEEEKKEERFVSAPEFEEKLGELKAQIGDVQDTIANLMDEVGKKDRRIEHLEGQVKSLTAGIRNTENQIILDKEMIATKVAQEVVKRMLKPVSVKTVKPVKPVESSQ